MNLCLFTVVFINHAEFLDNLSVKYIVIILGNKENVLVFKKKKTIFHIRNI